MSVRDRAPRSLLGALPRRLRPSVLKLHDRHVPELRADYDRLRERLEREGLAERVLTDWV